MKLVYPRPSCHLFLDSFVDNGTVGGGGGPLPFLFLRRGGGGGGGKVNRAQYDSHVH